MIKNIFYSLLVTTSFFVVMNFANAGVSGVDVYVDGSVAGPGTGTQADPFKTIQSAIDDAATIDGDIIHIADGTYTITNTIEVTKSLTLQGTSQSGTIINASGATGSFGKFGVHSSKSNITFSDFTLTSPSGTQGRGFKLEGTTANTSGAAQNGARSANIAISRVTVNGDGGTASRTGIDINGVNGVTLTDVTSNNNGGNGISLTDSSNVTMTNITTSGNKWGGIALYTLGQYYPGGISGVTITGQNSSEINPLYNQNEGTFNGGSAFTTTSLSAPQFTYTGTNNLNAATSQYVWYNDDANEIATWISNGTGDTAHTKVISVASGNIVVTSSQTIQSLINSATAGDTIVVPARTYTENLTINKSLTLIGANSGTFGSSTSRVVETTIDGNGVDAVIKVSANNVTIDGFKIKGGAGTSLAGVFSNPATNSGLNVKNNIITDNAIGVYAECVSCKIERNLFDGNNRTGAAGGSGIYTEHSTNLTIENNEFKNHLNNSAIVFAAGAAGAHTGTVVSNNWIHDNNGNNSMIYVVGMTGGTFSGNTLSQTGSNVLTFSNANSSISVTGNQLVNSYRGIRVVDNGDLAGNSSSITVVNNGISGNSQAGLEIVSGYTGTLDAKINWWGQSTGPNAVTNTVGTGDKVIGDVNVFPWCTDPACSNVYGPANAGDWAAGRSTSGSGSSTTTSSTATSTATTTATSTEVLQQQTGTSTEQVLGASTYNFTRNLSFGMRGNDVSELQKILIAKGYLKLKTGLPTGWFGPLTRAALIKWQLENNIRAEGYFGPISRGLLNPKN